MLKGTQQYTEEAAHAADISAIWSDLLQSGAAARIYLSGKYDLDGACDCEREWDSSCECENAMRTRRALYESALISYRRAFAGSSSRIPCKGRAAWKAPSEMFIGFEDRHKKIIDAANKCVAHRVSTEAVYAEYVDPAPEGPTLKLRYREYAELLPDIIELIVHYADYLLPELALKQVDADAAVKEE